MTIGIGINHFTDDGTLEKLKKELAEYYPNYYFNVRQSYIGGGVYTDSLYLITVEGEEITRLNKNFDDCKKQIEYFEKEGTI